MLHRAEETQYRQIWYSGETWSFARTETIKWPWKLTRGGKKQRRKQMAVGVCLFLFVCLFGFFFFFFFFWYFLEKNFSQHLQHATSVLNSAERASVTAIRGDQPPML